MGVLNKYQIISILNENERTNEQTTISMEISIQSIAKIKQIQTNSNEKKTTTLIISKSTVNFVDYSVFVINRSMITIA